jgi:8-oxo-dGTP pyrophosphatase MutT (NUDIX family)
MSDNPHPTWKRLSQKTVHKGRMHIVEHKVELPNGDLSAYEVDHAAGGAAAVLIKTQDNKILLTHQFRFPLNQWIYDLPGGGIDEGETPEQTAIRECREEAGIAPGKIEKLAMFYPNPARADWPAHVFYCEDFAASEFKLNDPSENIERVLMPTSEFKKMVDEQKIVDPMLLIAWYAACSQGRIKT